VHAIPMTCCHLCAQQCPAECPILLRWSDQPGCQRHLHSPRLPLPVGAHQPPFTMASDEVRVPRCGHSARPALACGGAACPAIGTPPCRHARRARAPCTPPLTRPCRLCPTTCTPLPCCVQAAGQVVALRFLVDPAAAGAILGKQGSTITECEAQSGARIQLSRSTEVRGGTQPDATPPTTPP
jgi:hypothetical protein